MLGLVVTTSADDTDVPAIPAPSRRRRWPFIVHVIPALARYGPFLPPNEPTVLSEGIAFELASGCLDQPSCLEWWNGTWLLVCERSEGRTVALHLDDAGELSDPAPVLTSLAAPHGLLRLQDPTNTSSSRLLVSEAGRLLAWDLGASAAPTDWVLDSSIILTSGIRHDNHQQNTVRSFPNGTVIWHSGSTCNEPCGTDGACSARLIGLDPWSRSLWVATEGVRNSWERVWVSGVEDVFTDNGKDWEGDWPLEELNLLEPGAHYGWDLATPLDEVPSGTVGPIGVHDPHSSTNAIDLRPAHSVLPEGDRTLYVTVFGSWNSIIPVGEQLLRLDIVADAAAAQGWVGEVTVVVEDLTAPLPLRFGPQGDLWVASFTTGELWRVHGA